MAESRARIGKQLEKSVTPGSLIISDASNEPEYYPVGTDGQVLTVIAGIPTYANPSTSALSTAPITINGTTYPIGTPLSTIDQAETDVPRAFYKSGDTDLQAYNSEGVLSTNSIVHIGKVNIGANETVMPFLPEYTHQVFGNQRVAGTGFNNTNINFNRQNVFNPVIGSNVLVYVDVVNGVDGLDPYLYYGYFGGGQSKFLTLNAAIDWANAIDTHKVTIRIENTTNALRALIGGNRGVMSKEIVFQGSSATGVAYINIRALYVIQGGIATFENCQMFTQLGLCFIIGDRSRLNMLDSTITLIPITTVLFTEAGGDIYLDASTFIFGANNQALCHATGNNGGTIIIGSHNNSGGQPTTFVTGAFTGIKLSQAIDRAIYLHKMPAGVFPANFDLRGAVIQEGGSLTLNQTNYDAANLNTLTLLNKYSLVAYYNTPIRTPDMTSNSANIAGVTKAVVVNATGEFGVADLNKVQSTYPTAVNLAATPVPTQGIGTMTVNSANELLFWNGTVWRRLD